MPLCMLPGHMLRIHSWRAALPGMTGYLKADKMLVRTYTVSHTLSQIILIPEAEPVQSSKRTPSDYPAVFSLSLLKRD